MLLHAFPADAHMWDGARGRLEEHVRVIAPDQRGLGQSPLDPAAPPGVHTPPEEVAQPDLDAVAADVLALMDRLELSRVHLGGCSMGGYVAMALLRAAPERVASLILADTKAVADTEQQRENRHGVADRAEREGIVGWLADNSIPGLLGSGTQRERTELVAQLRSIIERQSASGVAWAQRAMAARRDSSEALRAYGGPVLVVVGEQDTLSPPDSAAELAKMIDARFETIPGAGHLSPLENPSEFARVVLDWMPESR